MPTRLPRNRLPLLLAIGLLSGTFAGLFGIGGGTIIVPLLLLLPGVDERRATSASLLAIVVTASVGAAAQATYGHVHVPEAALVGLPAVLGVLAGTALQQRIPTYAVSAAFAALLVVLAATLLSGVEPTTASGVGPTALGLAAAVALGVLGGVVSGLVGVSGGAIFIPGLVLLTGLGHVEAEATSLLAVIPVSLVGALNQHRYGNLDVRMGLLLGLGSIPGAVAGVAVVNVLPARVTQIAFALLLLVVATRLARRYRQRRPGGVDAEPIADPRTAPAAPRRPATVASAPRATIDPDHDRPSGERSGRARTSATAR